jgi:death on curing protein
VTWRWLSEAVLLAIQEEQLAEHGGGAGVRDIGLLRSAMARPQNKAAYEDSPDAAALAAAYAFGICRNHPFIDGNKRAALIAAAVFLLDNGYDLTASEPDAAAAILRLANGDMTEDEFADWLRANVQPYVRGAPIPLAALPPR